MSDIVGPILPSAILVQPRRFQRSCSLPPTDPRTDTGLWEGKGGIPLKAGKSARDLRCLSQAGIKESLWVAVPFPSPRLSSLKFESLGDEGSIAHRSVCEMLKARTQLPSLLCWGAGANK